jgi:DNA (cytosine-5)-methyltransferase 1
MMAHFLDLFAGIGGFRLGAEWAGLRFDRHYFSEVDPYAIDVYSHRFPEAQSLGDIRGIRANSLP